ncbi:MAG: tRNA (N6-threonylcarbamoyladenosine(37)-N6)-methyltransferase TrmO [Oscillospiraceae bacterium]|nr:tRNA (N6-threonylcarbamoyladenosine(37)-N6)-methyltransferase TrmO [Oscillospiraceae bacterium]
MNPDLQLKPIATIHTAFAEKFGIPRQSGLIDSLEATIIFEPAYRNADALRGLEEFSHLWLIWGFSKAMRSEWTPTVRPPRLGGNKKMGVFATRSPFRPNSLGLSSVRLGGVEHTANNGSVIHVFGADMLDGTPIYDIKPYLSFTDSHPEAKNGFAENTKSYRLNVEFPEHLLDLVPKKLRTPLIEILEQDPRPAYQEDINRVYGFLLAEIEVQFTVSANTLCVRNITPQKSM